LFVLAQSRKWATYLYPEYFFFAFGALLIIMGVLRYGAVLVRGPARPHVMAAAAVIIALCIIAFGPLPRRPVFLGSHVYEGDIARGSSKAAIGDGRLVGGRIGLWYVSGATRWYDIASDVLWYDNGKLDLVAYFNRFDYVVEHAFSSEISINTPRAGVANWYQQHLLTLAGFYFGSNPEISFVRFAPRQEKIVGYVWRNGTLRRFESSTDGPATLVAAFCKKEDAGVSTIVHGAAVQRIGLPIGAEIEAAELSSGGPQEFVLALFDGAEAKSLGALCHVQETVRGRLIPTDLADILPLAERSRNRMDFELMRNRFRDQMLR
jgi:hypothetical protein